MNAIFASGIILLLASAASADGPINRRAQFLRIEQAPYPSAGYRPQGEQFRLPARQQQQPQDVYGPPPAATEAPEEVTTTTELPTTTEPTSEQLNVDGQEELDGGSVEAYDEEGTYYIYHPDGLLQRVVYASKSEDMGYTAKLTYKDVEPIKEAIYTYDPQTLVFSKIVF